MQLTDLKGIGKTRLEALHAAGICSLRDLLYAFPVRYRDVSAPVPVAQAQPGETACLQLTRRGEARLSRHGKLSRVNCTFADETGQISACWFNQPWMREHLNAGTRFTLYGRVEASGAGKRLTNPSLEKELGVVPVYRAIPGVPMRFVDWSAETEAELLGRSHVGIMPLPEEDPFARGKSAFKLIQYRAAGIPAIASPARKMYASDVNIKNPPSVTKVSKKQFHPTIFFPGFQPFRPLSPISQRPRSTQA